MSDVRELLARLNPTTIRMDTGTGSGGGVDALTNIDVAGALGMVPAGLGRDLVELLYGPAPSRADIIRVFHGITRLALEERNRRSRSYIDAKTIWGIADCMAKFERDRSEPTCRTLSMLKARAVLARERLFPEKLEDRMPQIAAITMGYMKGERLSNRERAAVLGVSDSTYREGWASVVDWLLTELIEAERGAVNRLEVSLSSH